MGYPDTKAVVKPDIQPDQPFHLVSSVTLQRGLKKKIKEIPIIPDSY